MELLLTISGWIYLRNMFLSWLRYSFSTFSYPWKRGCGFAELATWRMLINRVISHSNVNICTCNSCADGGITRTPKIKPRIWNCALYMQAIILYHIPSISDDTLGKPAKRHCKIFRSLWIMQQTGLGEQGKDLSFCRIFMWLDADHS